jgi:hypothetical protein
VVTGPGGVTSRPPSRHQRFGEGPPVANNVRAPQVSREVGIGDDASVTVFASRAGVDTTLRRLLVLVVAGIVTSP